MKQAEFIFSPDEADPRGAFCGNFLRPDAETLARRNPGLRIGPALAAGGRTRRELAADGVVGLYRAAPSADVNGSYQKGA